MNCVLLRWLMLFCVLSGVEQCHLLVLRVAKWTVSMISWKCDYPGKLWVCFELALKKLCYDCCIRSTVSLSCYPLVLMRSTCLAALQNKHMPQSGQLAWQLLSYPCSKPVQGVLSLICNSTKRQCLCQIYLKNGSSSGSWLICVRSMCTACPEASTPGCLPEYSPWCRETHSFLLLLKADVCWQLMGWQIRT